MQRVKLNTFGKVIVTVLLLLIPVVCLFSYSNATSVSVVEAELEKARLDQLGQSIRQMDDTINQLFLFTFTLSRDPSVTDFADIHLNGDTYSNLELQQKIAEKLTLQSAMSKWQNQLVVYSRKSGKIITTNQPSIMTAPSLSVKELRPDWHYKVNPANEGKKTSDPDEDYFVRDNIEPFTGLFQPQQAKLVIEVLFPVHNITNELDRYKSGGKGDPFLYYPGRSPITNHTVNERMIANLIELLDAGKMKNQMSFTARFEGEDYLVNVVKSESLGWYLVDYLPLENILAPITASRNLFYLTVLLLLLTGIVASFLIYRHVQMPILTLVRNVRRLTRGDYSTRISGKSGNEFDFLFDRFNDMASQIQQLVENVLQEKIRSREATLKQLQAQINPHFLYNCLYFIVGMTKLGEKESVIAMANNLGDYYRYTTRLESAITTVGEEIEFIEHYLSIQNLRMQRIRYEIAIPPAMADMPIPRLLLQPIVENAIVHGFEKKQHSNHLWIRGECMERECRIIVEDDGPGMKKDAISRLRRSLAQDGGDALGTGLTNVHRRLQLRFGERSGIEADEAESGGLRVTLKWEHGCTAADRKGGRKDAGISIAHR